MLAGQNECLRRIIAVLDDNTNIMYLIYYICPSPNVYCNQNARLFIFQDEKPTRSSGFHAQTAYRPDTQHVIYIKQTTDR